MVLLLGLLLLGFSITADSRPSLAAQGASTRAQGWPSKVDGSEALQTAVALVQQGRVEEAEQQVRLALGSPDTRPVANSVLGAIRLQQKRLDESATFLRESEPVGARPVGAHLSLAQVYTAAALFRSRGIVRSFGRIPDERPALHRRGTAAAEGCGPDAQSITANYQLGLLLAHMGKKEEADKHLELPTSLRKQDRATSRLQLRLLDPDR